MSYEYLLMEFLHDKQNKKYSAKILEKLTEQYRLGMIAEIRREGSFVERMNEIIESLVKDAIKKKKYTSSIIPTVVSSDKAPNFWFQNEKAPTTEEVYRSLYLLLTSLYQGNYVVNLDNVNEAVLREFRSSLIKKNILLTNEDISGIDMKKIRGELGIRFFPNTEFGFSLLILSYFVSWIKAKEKEDPVWIQRINELGLSSTLSELSLDDTLTLVTYNIRKQKKEMYITPRLKSFVLKWYEEFLTGKEDYPYILSFLSSLYVIHKNYRKISDPLMNKFIYYLLRENVNGELLTDIVNLKIEFELKETKGRPFPIRQARKFFANLG
jgi:hypothetical protein